MGSQQKLTAAPLNPRQLWCI